ncbi:MAG: hypothetical protein HQ567_32285 [Candidatus Nealsonbacteria bacterium]|nr:hypothetical protein [Candidatus Nealsonbacteria bacterium]
MYWFDERVIEKFGHLAGVPGLPAAKTVLSELAKVLQSLFVIRLSNQTLKLGMSWMSFDKVCERREEAIVFDRDKFVQRYLMNNSQLPRLKEFHTEIARNETRLLPDPRHQMNGHDFFALFYWYVHPLVSGKEGFSGEQALARTLRTCLELEHLDDQPMFQSILRRVDGAQP